MRHAARLARVFVIAAAMLLGAAAAHAQTINEIIDAGNGLDEPLGIAVDAEGNAYVTGESSDNAFKITPAGIITEIIDATGDDAGNSLTDPRGIAVDAAGNAYVVGFVTDNAFKITPAGVITEIIDATGDDAGNILNGPEGIAVDAAGNVYVACRGSANAFKITPAGVITEIIDATGDGAGNTLNNARGIAVDTAGNAYVTGCGSSNAFKITPGGVITEIIDATGDGAGNILIDPLGIAVDAAGNAYVTGITSDNAFKITPGGLITEIIDATGDGAGNGLDDARCIAVDAAGNVYVTGGTFSDNAFKITPGGLITEIIDATGDGAGNTLSNTFGIAVDAAGNVYVTGFVSDNAFKIAPDCNNNDIPDACDIDCNAKGGQCDPKTCGDSEDCNGNGVPDECDISIAKWTLQATTGPSPRQLHGMAYDSEREVTVVFGGSDPVTLGDTWEWNGFVWTLMEEEDPAGKSAPVPRSFFGMTYDSGSDVTVLFGGYETDFFGDTWEWNGTAWTRVAEEDAKGLTAPTPRRSTVMAYDSARGVTMLFGGEDGDLGNGTLRNDTWEWNGDTWTEQNPPLSPSARGGHAMAYDSERGVVVLFGGYDGARLDDTWEWDGSTWTQRPVLGPGVRNEHAMAYDNTRGVTVLFGGHDEVDYGDTWEWDGNSWTLRADAGLTPLSGIAMAFDSRRNATVLFGGFTTKYFNDTWEYATTAQDCNTNGIPDECDIADCMDDPVCSDCNGNGIPDECDIAEGTSADEDGGGVPDECEAEVLFVKADAEGLNHGISWDDAYTDLQSALSVAANPGNTVIQIWVAQGSYTPSKQTDPEDLRTATFQLINGVGLYGGFDGTEATLEERVGLFDQTILTGDLNGDDGSESACCVAQPTPGCGDAECEALICEFFPDCCLVEWDGLCALLVRDVFGFGVCPGIECTNSNENSYHVLDASDTDSSAVLDGVRVTRGNANNLEGIIDGGGLFALSGSPTISNSSFVENDAYGFGAAVYMEGSGLGCPLISDSSFTWNSGHNAVFLAGGSFTLSRCTFVGNFGSDGGGLFLFGGGAGSEVNGCLFEGNFGGFGGGMYALGTVLVNDSKFLSNLAVVGGGIYLEFGDVVVNNCLFSGNQVEAAVGWPENNGGGGGIANVNWSDLIVANSTFVGNTATMGGGILNGLGCSKGCVESDLTVSNSIFWDNSDDSGTTEAAQVYNAGTQDTHFSITYSLIQGLDELAAQVGNIEGPPNFIDPDGADDLVGTIDDNLRLLPGSPAIDSGRNEDVPEGITTDLDGKPRFIDDPNTPDCPQQKKDPRVDCGKAPIVDMGAYEFQADCNDNDILDECDLDCGAKGGPCDVEGCGQSADCNGNGIPDECEVPAETCADVGGICTEGCDPDCNENCVIDACDVDPDDPDGDLMVSDDCNGDGVPDECELPESSGGLCTENCDPDCNENGILDECDIADMTSSDCNVNGIPDECELPEACDGVPCTDCDANCNDNCFIDACEIADCTPDDPACQDCDGNGVPDECQLPAECGGICTEDCDPDCNNNGKGNCIIDACDIANCPPDDHDCDDCNLNGVPDECDIDSGTSEDLDKNGIPDECIEFDGGCAKGDPAWTCPENWEGDIVPDNSKDVSFSVTLIDIEDDVFLDADITIDTLRILNDATLSVTQVGTGDFTVADPGGILVEGNLLVANDRLIDATAGAVTIGPGGIYQADPMAVGPITATLQAGGVTVSGGPLKDGGGGSMVLTDSMAVVIDGDLLLEEDGGKGCDTPPDLSSTDNAQVRVMGTLVIEKCAKLTDTSSEPVILDGDMQNQSTFPLLFDWDAGELRMNGVAQTIEAAGEDRGPWPFGLEDNFVIGTLTLAENAVVQVVDEFDNQQDGVVACDEALYVDTLNVGPGAVLLTDGCRVYYNTLINDGAVPGLGSDVLQILPPIPADLNGDGKVDAFDLALLLGSWGPCPAPCAPEGEPATCPASCTPDDHMEICRADISGDCEVEAFDLAQLLGSWGPAPL